LKDLREAIVRGRIELNKREGLGLAIPYRPGNTVGVYFSLADDDGEFPVSHNDLATPALTLLGIDPDFETRQMVRQLDSRRQRARLRFRMGERPYFDLAWSTTKATDVFASQWLPVTFFDLDLEEFEFGIEDVVDRAPAADLLWRVDFRRGTSDAVGFVTEEYDRVNASLTVTRNLGRVKTDFEFLGSAAWIEPSYGGRDLDILGAFNLRMVHFRDPTPEQKIDPRGYEYSLGFVTRQREFGEAVELVQETLHVGVKLREVLRRTDLQILPNYFRNIVRGKENENSSHLELNVVIDHRLVDLVNDLERHQSRQLLGLAQWAMSLRLFQDVTLSTIDDFESRGYVAGSFLELFSGPLNRSTVILEMNYEWRDYYHLDRREEMMRFLVRLGF
jgi:hypothetical protein